MIFLQTLDKIAWRTGTKPVGINLLTSQCSYKTERIKHILRILTEMVAIIILTLQRYGIFPTHSELSRRYAKNKEIASIRLRAHKSFFYKKFHSLIFRLKIHIILLIYRYLQSMRLLRKSRKKYHGSIIKYYRSIIKDCTTHEKKQFKQRKKIV